MNFFFFNNKVFLTYKAIKVIDNILEIITCSLVKHKLITIFITNYSDLHQ